MPRRVSLVELTANSVRKAIVDGVWTTLLPTERRLCEIFGVSRPTIRGALHLLANEKWIEIRQGRRIRLVPRPVQADRRDSRLICLVTHLPEANWSLAIHQVFAQIRSRLAAEGFAVESLVCDAPDLAAQQRQLENYLQQNRVACCVLVSLKYELHRWFAARPTPALVVGMCDPSVRLPSIQTDLEASCRHAAGIFLRQGHRHLAFLVPNSGRGGDVASEVGFQSAVERAAPALRARVTIVRHNNTAAQVLEKLDGLFAAADAPTALLVAKPPHVYTTILFLQRRGLRVPADVSLIARESDPSFALMSPAIAHYRFDARIFGNRLARRLMKLAGEQHLIPRATLIDQQYFAGATVGRRA